MRVLLYLLLLTLTYALVLASFKPWDLAIGVAVSGTLLFLFRRFVFDEHRAGERGVLRRVLAFWPFAAVTAWRVVVGTWEVALLTLHLRKLENQGIVAVPIGERTPLGVAVSALSTTLSPGTVLIDVDWEREVMLIHVIDASDPDAFREGEQDFYRRYQRKVFP
ncbi:MAG: Na+/H+ antiporter subunit E [Rubrobacteraceae bacterium]